MDPIDVQLLEEDEPVCEMVRECARLWDKYAGEDAPETRINWDDLNTVVREDLSTLRKLQRQKVESAKWANL